MKKQMFLRQTNCTSCTRKCVMYSSRMFQIVPALLLLIFVIQKIYSASELTGKEAIKTSKRCIIYCIFHVLVHLK
jgi:hypothetical protein